MTCSRIRRSRAIAVFVAAIVTVSLVSSCGEKPDLAAQRTEQAARENQDKALAAQAFRSQVAAAMRRAAAQRLAQQRRAALQRRLAQQHRAAAQRLARQRQARAISAAIQSKTAHVSQVLQYFGLSPFDLCGPIGPNGGGTAQRRARQLLQLRRKQALRFLNLSCP